MELLQGPNKDNINTLIFYEYFQTENEFCIVRELMGDNLNKFLFKKGKLNVKEIYEILLQLNNTFRILYDNNLSHKNLRLENILTKKKEGEKEEYIFKLIGLEFNTKVYELLGRGGIRINERYKAPEILHGDLINQDIPEKKLSYLYQKADIWSLGVIIFILYFGEFPYEGNKPKEILSNILKNENARLNEINDRELQDLLKKMLKEDKDERIGWEEYFSHKFFSKEKWE